MSLYSTLVTNDAPTSYWRFNETSGTNAADSVGANAGTYTNSPTLGVQGGVNNDSDKAVLLTAANLNYVLMGNVCDIAATDFTIEATFQAAAVAQAGALVTKRGTGAQWQFGVGSVNSGGSFLSGLSIFMFTYNGGTLNTTNAQSYHTTSSVVNGGWHHVVATRTSGVIAIYVDGVSAALTADLANVTAVNITNTNTLKVGWNQVAATNYFNGTADEVAIWPSTALTAAQINAHYQAWRSSLPNNYQFMKVGDGMSVSEKIR